MKNEPKLIKTWAELKECVSETHTLEIDLHFCSGWIKSKEQSKDSANFLKNNHYLSTHTFYGSNYKHSTEMLQRCGFNIQLANWDD